jgi:hypothetical protein
MSPLNSNHASIRAPCNIVEVGPGKSKREGLRCSSRRDSSEGDALHAEAARRNSPRSAIFSSRIARAPANPFRPGPGNRARTTDFGAPFLQSTPYIPNARKAESKSFGNERLLFYNDCPSSQCPSETPRRHLPRLHNVFASGPIIAFWQGVPRCGEGSTRLDLLVKGIAVVRPSRLPSNTASAKFTRVKHAKAIE